jgi:hypothetical protein
MNERRRGRIAVSALIIAVLSVGVTAVLFDRLKDVAAPPATVSIPTPQARTVEEQRYLDAVLPLTERLVGEGRLLSDLGQSRSRDILALRTPIRAVPRDGERPCRHRACIRGSSSDGAILGRFKWRDRIGARCD